MHIAVYIAVYITRDIGFYIIYSIPLEEIPALHSTEDPFLNQKENYIHFIVPKKDLFYSTPLVPE
jgi:hypothetical protein